MTNVALEGSQLMRSASSRIVIAVISRSAVATAVRPRVPARRRT